MASTSVSVRNMTRRVTPRFPYAKVAEAILPHWDISLVFVGPTEAKELNMKLRRKYYVPNVLSYELGNRSGEVIICLAEAKAQASSYGLSYTHFTLYLFIHALIHLKGHPHGPTMERMERALLAQFVPASKKHLNETTHRNRYRHRHAPDESRGGGRGARRQGGRKS